jgi:hypothetical protein
MLRISLEPLSRRQRRNKVAWIFGSIIILVYSLFVNPAKTNITTCRFHNLTGLDCPTCGISRSFYALSHLDILDAFNYHIFGPILFMIFLFLSILFISELISKKNIKIISPFINIKWFSGIFLGLWLTTWMFKILT